MKQEYIVFNGHSSKEFGLYISSDFKIKSAKNDIQVVEIMGRDGAVLIPNKRLLPVDQSIPFFIKLKTSDRRSLTDVAQEISAWLHTSTWTELKLSWDPLYTYRAIMLEDFEIEETLRKFGKLSITFKLHPVKYLESGKLLSTVSNGETIVNPTTLPSKPYFELRGTGNVTVRIGEESMSFKNVSTGINVDCEKCSAWFGQTAAYDQLVTDNFLKIQPGINTIRLDNSSFILRLRPNWGGKSMICVFDSKAQTYYGTGLGVTPDWLSAKVVRERNGSYYFEGEYLVGGENANVLQIDNVIQTSAGQRTKKQWFDIVKITQKDNKTFTVYAEHISYRLKKIVLLPNATVSGNGDIALQGWANSIIVPGHGFRTWSNIMTENQTTFRVDKIPNARTALGGTDDSILAKWGGEYEFDNFTIKLWKDMGRKQPTRITFGKNLLSLEDSQSSENSYTHIMPYVIKDNKVYTLPNNEFVAWNTLGTNIVRVLPVNFSDHFKENPNIVKPDEEPTDSTASASNENIETPEDTSEDTGTMGEEGETKEAEGGHWASDDKGWWFVFANGKYPKNRWVKIEGKWYRFKKNGYMYENQWFKDKDGTRYFLSKSGAMATGWTPIKNRWRYFDKDGAYDSSAKKEFELDEGKLRKLAQEYVEKNNHYTYEFQTTVKYVDLAKAGEGIIEEVELCDQLLVTIPESNIDRIALKIVATNWNCLLEQYDDLTLGTLNSLLPKNNNNFSQQISSAIDAAMSTIAGNQAYQFQELKGLVGRTGDNMNDVYWGSVDEEPAAPKGGFKEGDMWWASNGPYKQLKRWTGDSWELIVDTEDPKKMLAKYDEKAEERKEEIKREIAATIASAKDEASEKAYENFKKDLLNSESNISVLIKKNVSVDPKGIEELRKKLEETNENVRLNTESIGGDGSYRYNKNRLEGETHRTIELGTDYIEVGHNGNGFEVGKEYTISWSAECTPYGHRNLTVNVQSAFFVENGHVILRPVDTRFPTIEHDISKSNRVIPMVYLGDYNIEFSGNWFKPVPVRKTVAAGDEVIVIPHTYKPIIDSNGDNRTETVWSENPQIIIDGGSA